MLTPTAVSITLFSTTAGTEFSSENCLWFRFEKEEYTPYTYLSAVFLAESPITSDIASVKFFVGGNNIHYGLIERFENTKSDKGWLLKIISKGFTSLLTQNQITPGLKNNVSLNSLMTEFIQFPNITYENNSTTVNYIYVKQYSTFWDAVTNLCYKVNSSYPYISGTNQITFSLPSSQKYITIEDDKCTSCGKVVEYSKIISDIHMQDINGNYNSYNLTDTDAKARNIVRHKHIDLDRQYLNSPDDALDYRRNLSYRGWYSFFVETPFYQNCDLNDKIKIVSLSQTDYMNINKIVITGNQYAVTTKVFAYQDKYCNKT